LWYDKEEKKVISQLKDDDSDLNDEIFNNGIHVDTSRLKKILVRMLSNVSVLEKLREGKAKVWHGE